MEDLLHLPLFRFDIPRSNMTPSLAPQSSKFHPFAQLPVELQREIWALALPPPSIVEPYFLYLPNPHGSLSRLSLRLSSPNALDLSVFANVQYPSLDKAPLPVLLKARGYNAGDPPVIGTVHLRPERDILYLSQLISPTFIDVAHFISRPEHQLLRRIALTVDELQGLRFTGSYPSPAAKLIRGLPNLEIIYAMEGEEYHAETAEVDRNRACELQMVDVKRGRNGPAPIYFNPYAQAPKVYWVTELADELQREYKEKVVEEMERSSGAWKAPKLECKELRREYCKDGVDVVDFPCSNDF
jgi:hypothetical protein